MEAILGTVTDVVKEGLSFDAGWKQFFIEGSYEESAVPGESGILIEHGSNRLYVPSRVYFAWFHGEMEPDDGKLNNRGV